MNTKELFERYNDPIFEQQTLRNSRILAFSILIFTGIVAIINSNVLPNNPILDIIGDATGCFIPHFFLILTFLLLTSDNPKMKWFAYISFGISTLFIIGVFLSFFQLFGFENIINFECETKLFGLYNIVLLYFLVYCMIVKKYENLMQILAILSVIIGFAGLLYYLGSIEQYSKSIHYIVFHIFESFIFILLPTKNGLFKSFTQQSKVSNQSYNLMKYAIAGICIMFCIIEMMNPILKPIVGDSSVISATASLVINTVIFTYYSRRLVKKDLEGKVLKDEALILKDTIQKVESLSKIAIVTAENNQFKWTREIFKILETTPSKENSMEYLIKQFVTPEYQEQILEEYEDAAKTCKPGDIINFEHTLEIRTENGNNKYIKCYTNNYIKTDFESRRIHGFIQDITSEVETRINLENSLKNQTILLQEVHHRVKNNLQIILSLINLELKFNEDNYEYVLKKTRDRINSMAAIHEQVYNSSDIAHVDSEEYINLTLENLFNLYSSNINLRLNVESYEMHMDKAIPIGLIINELGLNAMKYAFKGNDPGNFYVKFRANDNLCELNIWDDGVGLPEGMDFTKTRSLGFTIIQSLIKQIDGELEILDLPQGFGVKIKFTNDI